MTKARPSPTKERPESRDCQAKRDGQSQTTMVPSAIPPAGRADDVADRHPTRPETGTGGETAGVASGSTGPPAGPVATVTIESREPLALLGAVRSGDSWMLPVVINEIPVLALVDTGASVTMISRTVYESMNREKYPLLCSEQSSVSGVGGGKVGLMGSIKGEFQIAGGTWPLEVYVSQRQEPVSCYLGMNFFQDYGVEFRLKTGEFVINGKTVPMQREGRRIGFCARIKVDRDVYIPPRSESIIQGLAERTHHNAAGQWGIIEPGLSARALQEMGVTVGSAVTSTALSPSPSADGEHIRPGVSDP